MTLLTCANGDITLAYETFGTTGEPLLLIAPMGQPGRLSWPEDFCAALVDRGFQVARFDNRDSGASTHLDPAAPRYDLADMAADALAVLDALGWPAAHLAGPSLGGMIGQVLAVRHADRVRSLTSISSAPGWGWRISRPRLRVLPRLLALKPPTDPESHGEHLVALSRIAGSPAYPVDEEWLRAIGRQCATAPTLVLHGAADPLQSPHAARETARAIPGARLVVYPGMGHDLPRPLWPAFLAEIAALVEGASAASGR